MPLLEQVDGPNLYQYDETEKVYSGRAVKVMAESSLDIPIRISAPGSIVEYTVEKKSYDFNLGITAKLDQGGTAVVKVSATISNSILLNYVAFYISVLSGDLVFVSQRFSFSLSTMSSESCR